MTTGTVTWPLGLCHSHLDCDRVIWTMAGALDDHRATGRVTGLLGLWQDNFDDNSATETLTIQPGR